MLQKAKLNSSNSFVVAANARLEYFFLGRFFSLMLVTLPGIAALLLLLDLARPIGGFFDCYVVRHSFINLRFQRAAYTIKKKFPVSKPLNIEVN